MLNTLPCALKRFAMSSLVATLISINAPSQTMMQHAPLLPRVQQLRYGNGALPLCSLTLSTTNSEDPQAVAEVRQILEQHCNASIRPSTPVELTHETSGSMLPGANETTTRGSRESYAISIGANGVKIHAMTGAGVFYAVQTLRQMIEGSTDAPMLPFAEIADWPAMPYRGFMMDMSHGAILTVAEVKKQLDQLAEFKANQYFFYVETDLDLDGYPLLRKDSNWSKQDIRAIVEYARQRHIDVVPCVELYGHLHDLFRLERYSDLAALSHGGEANPADPRIQHILEDWLRQYAELFPSPWLHLGFDEPFELERAGSKTAGVAPDVLWLQHLQRLAGIASGLGKRPLFWADIDEGAYIFNKYPGLAAGLPKNAIAAPWFYDARPDYSNLLDLFAANHVPILVTTGISDWDNIAPDFESTFINIDGFLAAGRKANAIGMLNTEWSDSALALHREALAAVAYGAAAAWQSKPMESDRFFAEYAQIHHTPAAAEKIAAALSHLTAAQSLMRQALGSETSFRMWDNPFEPHLLARIKMHEKDLHTARLDAEQAEEELLTTGSGSDDEIDSLIVAAKMLDYTGMKFLYAIEIAANFDALPEHPSAADIGYLLKRETSSRNHSRVGDLLDTAGELEASYSSEWLKQYKPYRLATAQARWRAEQEFWRHFQASVWTVTQNFQEKSSRPTLADVLAVR
ncbi:Glycosyl hydrolase family 20, catalytic domain [Granulicella pectinivorans]|uniref:beta-N-acetylhexosaminidase n=1 Tax=Granulicella pectinivorans TaxID=474950 RepID=A0A1I6L518_9BACT|nr:glycoside hydrolase family 20 zincin-like fold domain-containing protein [Granulicella pectinivorans]SFR98524.1 Glycosyl hydrolase family 20, catalytic domain [Granulicella pectinivorans]